MDNTPLQTDAIFKVGVCNLKPLWLRHFRPVCRPTLVQSSYRVASEETFLHNFYIFWPIEQTRECRAVVQLIVIQ